MAICCLHLSGVSSFGFSFIQKGVTRTCPPPAIFSLPTVDTPQRTDGYCWRLQAAEGEDFVEAEDLEALQELFTKYCDSEGLMTRTSVMQLPAITELMVRCADMLAQSLVCDGLSMKNFKML
jgi:hypothetical protein